MPTPKPEAAAPLGEKRIAEVREVAELKIAARARHNLATLDEIGRRAETVLALIAEREEARRHILIARDNLRADGNPYAKELTTWLEGKRSTEEGEKL